MRRYEHAALVAFTRAAMAAAGMRPDMAAVAARRILDADLAGHDTHGLALLPRYLDELVAGGLRGDGEIEVVSDRGACALWDAQLLSGHWVMEQAMAAAVGRVETYGAVNLAVRRSHHVGALQVYLTTATDRGLLCLLWATDSLVRTVAPFGSAEPVLTSEPIAAGIPTRGEPILVDTTTSMTSNGYVKRAYQEGRRLPWPALIDAEGAVTDDPAVLFADPPGTILPLGGVAQGYKGYALALLVSAMSLALPGWGRLSGEKAQGFLLQVIDPDAFGGREAFLDETDWMARATRGAKPLAEGRPVRLPGTRALEMARRQAADGVALDDAIVEGLEAVSRTFGVALPAPRE